MSEGRVPILYIAPWVDLGGSDKGTIDWFKSLDRDRWAPSLITTQPSANRWLHHLEPYAEEVWDLPDLMPGNAFPELILGFIESRGVQVVHIMNSRLAFDLLPDVSCLSEPPVVVVQLHAEEPDRAGYVRYVTRHYGNLVDAFSLTSRHLAGTVASYEIAPSKIEVIHSGVDGEHEFDPSRVEPLALERRGISRVLWPARLVEQKDPMLALDVVARVRERGGEVILDMVGDGHLGEAVRDRAEQLGVTDVVSWHPPSQEMARWYRSADLVLMTSAYEGVPYVIYESLAMGVPVVAPALPGNVEFMDADSGVLVEPRDDAGAYADAIVSLLGDDERRHRMGERSRRRMLSDFSLVEMGRRHSDLYERLLGRQTATALVRARDPSGERDPQSSLEPMPGDASPSPGLRLPREPPPDATVGVIVPCFRHGIFLDACIDSVRAQTLTPAQVVVVDDGSDDVETIEALARLDGDPDISVLRQPTNLGPSAARNRALGELNTSYVLPIDADDALLPDALESMVSRLAEAPEDVGFIYPHIQHIGNRHDYVESPAYNLWLLMQQNYCPAPALFDRRLFDGTGIRYPEEILIGHEDWDLILQLAERGVRGLPANRPTFLYRKQGFSRANAVDYGPDLFRSVIEERHPRLYQEGAGIKAHWAPALSIVLLDDDEGAWAPRDLSPLAAQTWRDFELLARTELGEGVTAVADEGLESPLAWLQDAIHRARGRWVLLLPRFAASALESPSFAEQLLHTFVANEGVSGVVLAEWAGRHRRAFAQLDDLERLSAEPVAVAFERVCWGRIPELRLGLEESPLADIAVGLRDYGYVQWRLARASRSNSPWRQYVGDLIGSSHLDVNLPKLSGPDGAARRMILYQPPRLPELTPGTVRRWKQSEPWTPPQTQLLCRHLDPRTGLRMVTQERKPPPGYRLEWVLGSTRFFPGPGSRRLIHAEHSFKSIEDQASLSEGEYDMGHIEDQALPMLARLELRRVGGSGQETLVCGTDDPLVNHSEPIEVLGWIEPCPILPRADDVLHTGPWGVVGLRRQVDGRTWRHRYRRDTHGEDVEGLLLGLLNRHTVAGTVTLRLRPDGRLASELCAPGPATRDPRKIARWLAAPLRAEASAAGKVKGVASRLRHLVRHFGARRLAEDEGVVIGHLRRENIPGTSTLYSTIHPVTGDQLVTRFPDEATAAGYLMDGILGAIFDPPDDAAAAPPEEMPWGRVSRG